MVDGFVINGDKELNGIIEVSGAKNAALPIIMATLAQEGEYTLSNVPDLLDIHILFSLLTDLGLIIEPINKNTYKIINQGIKKNKAEYDIVKKMRASFLAMGGMVTNLTQSIISLPGGCSIGIRPVGIHLDGFEALGVNIEHKNGYVYADSTNIHAGEVSLSFPSVGATQNLMIAAAKIKGTTTLINVAREPEVVDLGNFLIKMGAKITGLGTNTVVIEGGNLHSANYAVMYDRIEAGTYVIASLITKGKFKIRNANIDDLGVFRSTLESMGVRFNFEGDLLSVEGKVKDLKPKDIITMPHPGFPTDMQPQIMLLLSLIPGVSQVEETIFENRFMHVAEFCRMGANIKIQHGIAIVVGVEQLQNADVMACDLRAGASLVLAALATKGETKINRIYHIDRGYEHLENKLMALGADIVRQKVNI